VKIVYVSHGGSLGAGGEISFLEFVKCLTRLGHTVHAILPSEEELASELQKMDVPYSAIPLRWWVSTGGSFKGRTKRLLKNGASAVPLLVSQFRKLRPDLVISNTIASPAGAFAANWCRIPHIWFIQEYGEEDQGLYFDLGRHLSLSLINRLSKFVIVSSVALQQHFAKYFGQEKVRIVRYSIDLHRNADGPSASQHTDGVFQVILVGRMIHYKRQDQAIRAIALLVQKGFPVRLQLVGSSDPEYVRRLHSIVKELNLREHVYFAPFTKDPYSFILSSHVALMCSNKEAFGRVTVEAMKLGKPVIGANSGGTAYLIQDGFNGLLYASGSIEDLASKITILINDRGLLKELGENAQRWATSNFNVQNQVSDIHAVLKEVQNGVL
jgi:glycosyltransferase involved in cell wall biosynthesis